MGAAPGVQAERTALAWQRTALAVLVTSVLVLALAARLGEPVVLAVAAPATAVSAVVALGLSPRRGRGAVPGSVGSRLTAVASAVVVLGAAVALGALVTAARPR